MQIQLQDQSFSISAVSYGKLTLTAILGATSSIYPGMVGNIVGPGGTPSSKSILVVTSDGAGIVDVKAYDSLVSEGISFDFGAFNGGNVYFPSQLGEVPNVDASVIDTKADTIITDVGAVKTEVDFIQTDTEIFYDHFHAPAKCYPTLAAGVVVTKNNTAWTLGNFAVIVPTNTITNQFDIHGINYDAVSTNAVYEIVLYSGADGSEVEIGRIRTTRTGSGDIELESPFQSPINAANSQIKAKVAASNTGAGSVTISIRYHTY